MNQQIINQPFLYTNDLNITWASNTTLTISSGQCRNSTNIYDIVVANALTLNAAVNGANGLDTGTFAGSKWYAVYAIGDTTNTNDAACLISLSATAPLMLDGYDVFKRIGWARTDGSTHFLLIHQLGSGSEKTYVYDARVNVLNAQGSATYDAVDCSAAIPSTSRLAKVNWTFKPATQTNVFTIRPTGSSSTTGITGQTATVSVDARGEFEILTDSSQSIDYITTHANDDLSLDVISFVDYI